MQKNPGTISDGLPIMGHMKWVFNQERHDDLEARHYLAVRLQAPPEGFRIRGIGQMDGDEEFQVLFTPSELRRAIERSRRNPEDQLAVPAMLDMVD